MAERTAKEAATTRRIELDVSGMTCMMCARRVEKTLNRIDGVQASVKITSKVAVVDIAGNAGIPELCAAVQRAGYRAAERIGTAVGTSELDEQRALRRSGHAMASVFLRWLIFG